MINTHIKETDNDAIKAAPHLHKIIFENDKLRVIKVNVKPRDKADMHWHPENISYILSPGKLQISKPDGSITEIELIKGQVISASAGSHKIENIGDTEIQTIQIELK